MTTGNTSRNHSAESTPQKPLKDVMIDLAHANGLASGTGTRWAASYTVSRAEQPSKVDMQHVAMPILDPEGRPTYQNLTASIFEEEPHEGPATIHKVTHVIMESDNSPDLPDTPEVTQYFEFNAPGQDKPTRSIGELCDDAEKARVLGIIYGLTPDMLVKEH